MAIPTPTEIRAFLEGYGITTTQLSDAWIQARLDGTWVPFLENKIGFSFSAEETVTKYLSGSGQEILILPHKNVTEIVDIGYVYGPDESDIASLSLDSVRLIASEGILKRTENLSEGAYHRTFRKGTKNIIVQYKIGSDSLPADIKEAITMYAADHILGFVGARTGGSSLNVQGFGRSYGERGKYQDIRNDLARQVRAIIKKYKSHVVGT